jgi:hypothetical protein
VQVVAQRIKLRVLGESLKVIEKTVDRLRIDCQIRYRRGFLARHSCPAAKVESVSLLRSFRYCGLVEDVNEKRCRSSGPYSVPSLPQLLDAILKLAQYSLPGSQQFDCFMDQSLLTGKMPAFKLLTYEVPMFRGDVDAHGASI